MKKSNNNIDLEFRIRGYKVFSRHKLHNVIDAVPTGVVGGVVVNRDQSVSANHAYLKTLYTHC